MRERDIGETARLLGSAHRLLSTVLQGFHQSHQATAAAVQVSNVHLVRGRLGMPGCGVLQMNGRPSAQNTRECGTDGDLPAVRTWSNRQDRALLRLAERCLPETLRQAGGAIAKVQETSAQVLLS